MSPLRRAPSSISIPAIAGDPSAQADDAARGDAPAQVPRDTSPTWELELLISGVVIFALFQLPPVVDGALAWLLPRLSMGMFIVAFLVQFYAKAILYSLIASFVLHLSARAYWVALVGLDSVFPAGVRWDEVKLGPISKELYRERLPRVPTLIDRVDNVCSVIFATGFLAAFMFALPLITGMVLGGGAYLVSSQLLGGRWLPQLLVGAFGTLLVVQLVGSLLDKLLGTRLSPRHGLGWLLRRVAAGNYHITLMGVYGAISMTLFSNIRKKVMYPVFYLFFFGLLVTLMVEQRVRGGDLGIDGYDYVPEEVGALEVDPRFYADQRTGNDLYATVPFVQADVIREPYVRLFIPYIPPRHNHALERECAGARARVAEDVARAEREAAAATTLGCLARIHALRVNGVARPDLELRFATHPESEMRGMMVYIPTDGLPRGRNTVTVARPPIKNPPFVPVRKRPLEEHTIAFWL